MVAKARVAVGLNGGSLEVSGRGKDMQWMDGRGLKATVRASVGDGSRIHLFRCAVYFLLAACVFITFLTILASSTRKALTIL